jgi:hypothetical protein
MPLCRAQRHPPLGSAPGRGRFHRRRRLREVLVRVARVRGLRHVAAPAGGRVHASLRLVHGRRLQGGRQSDRLRRARALGKVCLRLQRAAVPPAAFLARPRAVHAADPQVHRVVDSPAEEVNHHGVYRDVLCHCVGVAPDAGELFHHRLVHRASRQVLPRLVRHLYLDHCRLHRAG